MSKERGAILLIDDLEEKLASMERLVGEELGPGKVCAWSPKEGEEPSRVFEELVGDETVLVVTDYDLTTAVNGFFGHTVVAWCRNRSIPVADFTRGHRDALSEEPDLFELRVPRGEAEAIAYIVRAFRGFERIRQGIERDPALVAEGRSPAQVLAALLGREDMESHLGPYLSRPGLFNSSLVETLTGGEDGERDASATEKRRLLTYILGHVLLNAVLKYPGPILGEGPLCAYLAGSMENVDRIATLFEGARYEGPFSEGERHFWRERWMRGSRSWLVSWPWTTPRSSHSGTTIGP